MQLSEFSFLSLSPVFTETGSYVQWNFNGSNTDGSFTTAVLNSFLSPLAQNPIAADLG